MKTCSLFEIYKSQTASGYNQHEDKPSKHAEYKIGNHVADERCHECSSGIKDKFSSYTHELQWLLESLEYRVPIKF